MLTFENSIYVIGGLDFWSEGDNCINTIHELNHESNEWTDKTNANHKFCALADTDENKIWMFGGSESGAGNKMLVYYYTLSTNI